MAAAKRVFFVFAVLTILTSVYSITRGNVQHAQAATPATLNFQARLMTSSGNLVPDGNYNIEFKLYNASTSTGSSQGACTGDANCLWTETRTGGSQVQVKNGYLSAYLGDITALPGNIWDQQLWLTMNIGGIGSPTWDGEMTPRIRMTSVPYAFQAKSSETLNKNTGSFTGTVDFATLTADRRYLFPDTSLATTASPGTICVYNGAASNCPAASGSAFYIQNDTVVQTQTNFNIQGRDNGVNGTVVGAFQGAAAGQTADLVQFKASNGTVLGAVTATGNLQVASSVDTYTGTTLSIGGANATAVSIGDTGVTTTINGALTVTQASTFNADVTLANGVDLTVGTGEVNFGGTLDVTGLSTFDGGITSNGDLIVAQSGNVAFQRNTNDYTTTGTQNDVDFGTGALFRLNGASAQTITSIVGGVDGRMITLINAGANAATLQNNSGGTATNRIITGTGGNLSIPSGSSVSLIYDSSAQRWRVVGSTATSGGGANQQLSNLGTTAINTSLNPDTDNAYDLGSSANSWRSLYADTSVLTPSVDRVNAGTLTIGTTNATAITIGKSGVTTTNAGALTVDGALSANAGATVTGGAVSLTGNAASSFTTSSGALTITSAAAAIWSTTSGNLTIQAGSGTVTLGTTTALTATGQLGITSGGANALSLDAGGAAAVNIGTTNANAVNISRTGVTTNVNGALTVAEAATFNGDVTIAAQKTLRLVGGTTAQRPASPSEGTLYYDTDTKRLLIYANGKWQSDRSTASRIVATSASGGASGAVASMNYDGADYLNTSATSAQTVINNALLSLPASGGTVYLMEGTYIIDNTVTIPNNVNLVGSGTGTVIKLANGTTATISMISNYDGVTGTNIGISNLVIDGNSANVTGTQNGIGALNLGSIAAARNGARIIGVTVQNVTAYGIGANALANSVISGSFVNNAGLSGIYLANNTGVTVSGNVARNNAIGIALAGGSGNVITANVVNQNTSAGIYVSSNYNTISGNQVSDNGGTTNNNGIYITSGDYNSITANGVADTSCGTGTSTCYGINIIDAASDANYIADNYITDTDGDATAGINNAGTGTVLAGQVNASGNYLIQPAGTIELMKNTNVTGNLSPTTTNTYDLGTSSLAWRTGYFGTSVLTPAVDTAAAAALGIGTTNATNITIGHNAGTFAVDGTNFDLATNGVMTLAGGQTADITTQANQNLTVTANGTGIINLNDNVTLTGTLTLSGAATDITTATNEDLTVVANGTGIINLNDAVTVGGNFTVTNAGNVAFQRNTTNYTATGVQDNVNFGTGVLFRITSASAVTINGIAGGADGRIITLANASANDVTLGNNASGTAANHVVTGTGSAMIVPAGASVQLAYDSSSSVWRVIGGTAISGGGGANRQLSNLTGTIAVNASLTTNADNTLDLGSSSFSWRTLYADTSVLTPLVDTATAAALGIGTTNATNITIGHNAGTFAVDGTNFDLATNGVMTLAGGQTADITTQTNQNLTLQANGTGTIVLNDTITAAGTMTFSGVATDITTGTNEDLTIVANGTGIINLNDSVTVGGTLTMSNVATDITTGTNEDLTVVANGTGIINLNDTVQVGGNFTVTNAGNVAFQRNTTNYSATGTQNDVDFGTGVLFRITSASALTITSVAGGADGRIITLANASANNVTLQNNSGGTAANRIITGTGNNLVVPAGSTVQLAYDSADSRWRVIGGTATAGGGANQQLSNLSGTVAVNASLTPGTSGLDLGDSSNNWRTLYTDTSVLTPLVGRATSGTLSIGTDANSTAVTISRTGVATTISGSLSVAEGLTVTNAGNVAFQNGATADYTTVGSANNVNFGTGALFRLNGASAQTITGIAGGADGRMITLINAGANVATLRNMNGSSTAANQISTGTGADLRLPAGASVSLAYDSDSSLWRVIGAVTGNSIDTIGTFNGATSYANGANISGNVLTFGAADGSNPGMVSTGTQTFAGAKTFTGNLQANAGITASGGVVSLTGNAASSLTTSAGALTLTSATAATWSTAAGTLTLQGGDGNVSLGTSTSLSANGALAIRSGGATVLGLDTGGAAEIQIGTTNANSILIGKASGQTIRVGQNGGTLQLDGTNFDVATNGVVTLAGNQTTDITSQAGNGITIKPGAATGANVAGGILTLQGGGAGTGNANGGAVTISGGAGVGTGTQGLVNLSTTAFSTSLIQTYGSAGVSGFNNPDNSIINNFSTIPVTASVTGVIVSVPDPAQTAIGRIVYVAARSGSSDFTLRLNASRTPIDIAMKANSTATLIWNGTDWTAAGASSSTDLQSAYNNTLTSAGGAEIILNPTGGAADGFTIRNNSTTPIVGGLLEVQSSIGTNLFSVNSAATEWAANGGAETSSTFGTNWTAIGTAGAPARTTTAGQYVTGQAGVSSAFGTAAGNGVRNNLATNPTPGDILQISFTAKLGSGSAISDLRVDYTPSGASTGAQCTSGRSLSTTEWTKITCEVVAAGAVSNPDILIYQVGAAGVARTIYIDNLSVTRANATDVPSNVQIGGGINGGQVTLFTLDRSSSPPVEDGNTTYYGSMYYDTTTGRIQCYEADGWGACGSPPDNIITLTPEYTGAVLNGNGVGVMTADFCGGGVLNVEATFCGASEARNYYRWTSPQSSDQTYSIYVNYKLPSTFKSFADANTMKITSRSDHLTLARADLQVYRKASAGGVTSCGAHTTLNDSLDQWQQKTFSGDETACGFEGGDYIIFKITVHSSQAKNIYIENIDFTYLND